MRRTMMQLTGALVLSLSLAGVARADETAKKAAPARRPITIELIITEHAQLPQAAVDIQKVALSRPLPELRQPLLDRIEKAANGAPF